MNIRNGLVLTTAVAAALAVTACGSSTPAGDWNTDRPTAVCTDKSGKRVDDRYCQHGGGSNTAFMLLYLNSGSYVPAYGHTVYGGSRTAVRGTTYSSSSSAFTASRASSVSRGGFGSSARGGGGFSSGS